MSIWHNKDKKIVFPSSWITSYHLIFFCIIKNIVSFPINEDKVIKKIGKWHVTIKSSNDYINNFICNRLPFGLCYKSNKMTIIGMCAALNSFTWTCFILCAQIWRRIKGNLRRVGRGHGYMQPSTPHVLRSLRRWGGGDRSFQSQLWKLTEVLNDVSTMHSCS